MHAGTLSVDAQDALAILGKSGILDNSYLAGGSALALQLGHRKSYDFDFYTRKKIRAEDLPPQLSRIGDFTTTYLEPPHTIIGVFRGVKFSLFRYDYPMLKQYIQFQQISMASIEDIAAMKLSAITGRATKRDYIDLYFISQKYSVDRQLDWYGKKFGKLGNNLYFIIKALGFFEDAESDNLPRMIKKISWDEVKNFFAEESMRLAKKHL